MMHERSYTPPFNLNGYESTATKNLLYRLAYWPRNGKKFASERERHTQTYQRKKQEREMWIYAS
jgi:hypothetical protein